MTMPESESEKYDIRRSHRRKDAESRGAGARDRHANEERGGQEGPGGQDEQLPETD
jgi:hypothetical protein